jgi:hypothetical protein
VIPLGPYPSAAITDIYWDDRGTVVTYTITNIEFIL